MKLKQKLISSVLTLALVLSNVFIPSAATQQLEVHHINVGQGDATYIEFPNGTDMLIDAGKTGSGTTVVNYLKKQEKNMTVDYLIATHPDADHVGGMQEVFKSMKVNNFIYPKDAPNDTKTWTNVLSLAKKEGCSIKDSKSGTSFNFGGAAVKLIHPTKDYSDTNEDSVVTFIDYKDAEFMFTGDIESATEKDMINQKLVKNIDFMSVPHHGSKTSSTAAFLKAADPEYAVVSVGKNSYGHPVPEVIQRYTNVGAKVYRTDKLGNIVIKTDGNTTTINGSKVSIGSTNTTKKSLTKDIYKYDAGKGKYLTYINGKGYSQYSYLNTSGNYAFTPSSWMKAAGLTVTMPTSSNKYTMKVDNPYISKYNAAKKLLDDINSGKVSNADIEKELNKIKNSKSIDVNIANENVQNRASIKKTLTKDIYKYDAGKGKYLTYINGRGYSQFVYLNTSGNYAFTPSSWMVAAGLTVTMPKSSNGYTMKITNQYMVKYNNLVKEIESKMNIKGMDFITFASKLPSMGFNELGGYYENGNRLGVVNADANGAYFGLFKNSETFNSIIKNCFNMLLPTQGNKLYNIVSNPFSNQTLKMDGRRVVIEQFPQGVFIEIYDK